MSLLRNIQIPQNLGNKFAHAFASCTRPSRLGLEFEASLGAVLSQKDDKGHLHPVAYASRALHKHERNYHVTELETLGIVWAAKYFRAYLLGHHCLVLTDHSACTSLLNSSNPSAKLARWAMIIQEMDLDIQY